MQTTAPSVPVRTGTGGSAGGDLLWVMYAPCGCACGWLALDIPGPRGARRVTDPWAEFDYGSVWIARMIAAGYRWEIEIVARGSSPVRECEHIPWHGTTIFDVPEGHAWAAASPGSTLEHLVAADPADLVEMDAFGQMHIETAPLCSDEVVLAWHRPRRADPCAVCEQRARGLEPGAQ